MTTSAPPAPVPTEVLEELLGTPVHLEELKHKPGRRTTLRATGPLGRAVVKCYASPRAAVVADRVGALAAGPPEPVVPRVLHVGPDQRVLVLSEVPGRALTGALVAGDHDACARAGAALGGWHRAWWGIRLPPLRPHTIGRELEILDVRAHAAPPSWGGAVRSQAATLAQDWPAATVVHRDLYEEQVVLGPGGVGLIDLDDAALGPPELDLGNLVAHVELLGRRRDMDLSAAVEAVIDGYRSAGRRPDPERLEQCRRLTLLRLACIHNEPGLLDHAF